jgi:hypothetical protein
VPFTAAATALAAAFGFWSNTISVHSHADARKAPTSSLSSAPSNNSSSTSKQLPVYTCEDVAKHKTKEQRIWVTYKARGMGAC